MIILGMQIKEVILYEVCRIELQKVQECDATKAEQNYKYWEHKN